VKIGETMIVHCQCCGIMTGRKTLILANDSARVRLCEPCFDACSWRGCVKPPGKARTLEAGKGEI